MINALTIDVEEYYSVSAFENRISRSEWDRFESRVCGSTRRLLDILSAHRVRATFFVLGSIAQQHPTLIREIREKGHEIGCHGLEHVRIGEQSPSDFRLDLRKAKSAIESVLGEQISSYRAASFSICKKTLWALEILVEEEFSIDSSIFPIYHTRYGIPGAPRFPFIISTPSGSIVEFPLTTRRLFGWNFPIAGGAYFRHLPYRFTRKSMQSINSREAQPAIFYLHPWEIDTEQPRQKAGWVNRARHYHNIDKVEQRLHRLLKDLDFDTLSHTLRSHQLPAYRIASTEFDTLFQLQS